MISIILPFKNNPEYLERLKLVVESIKIQTFKDLEIIVSEGGLKPSENLPKGIKHVFHPQEGAFSSSIARNYGVKQSRGEILYFNDSDVIFSHDTYLDEVINTFNANTCVGFCKPVMRRLCITEFDILKAQVEEKGLKETLLSFDVSQQYLATLTGKSQIKTYCKFEDGENKVFLSTKEDFEKFMSGNYKGSEPLFWTMNRHYGTLIIKKNDFENVGGYCTAYAGWGAEDDDLVWKLSFNGEIALMPYEVIHLDHSRSHFKKEEWEANKERLISRTKQNKNQVFEHDRKTYKSL